MADQDAPIIQRVAELAEQHGVSMTEISLAWLLTKVTAPVVGATKLHHIEGAAKAVDLELTAEERAYLEELYVPHPLVGVMAQNTPAAAKEVTSGPPEIRKFECLKIRRGMAPADFFALIPRQVVCQPLRL